MSLMKGLRPLKHPHVGLCPPKKRRRAKPVSAFRTTLPKKPYLCPVMIRVACIGDSITWGFTLLNPWKQSYPALLQEMLGDGYEVRNFGYNDASARFDADTPYVKKRVYRESLEWNPDIVLLMLGTNDTKTRNWDPDIFRRDYRKIVDSYLDLPSRPRVILIAPIRIFHILGRPLLGVHPETMEEGVRPAIRETADEMGLPMVDLQNLFTDTQYCRDGVHPQRTGARMLAETIYSSIQW
jgi:lysophospholipase L1-like esterase